MIIDHQTKVYVVSVRDGDICITQCPHASMTQSLYGPAMFELECGSIQQFKRQNKYIPITEEEIARLFINETEELLTEEQNEQN
jgi:hypothetical protein